MSEESQSQEAAEQRSESYETKERAKRLLRRFVSELGRGGTLFFDGRRDYLVVFVVAVLGVLLGGRVSIAAVALALLMVAAKLDALGYRSKAKASEADPSEEPQYDYGGPR